VLDTSTEATVLVGIAPEGEEALALVEQSEANIGGKVQETIGGCAYDDGEARQEFVDAGRKLMAKVPATAMEGILPKPISG
jgi:hypothetical protein